MISPFEAGTATILAVPQADIAIDRPQSFVFYGIKAFRSAWCIASDLDTVDGMVE